MKISETDEKKKCTITGDGKRRIEKENIFEHIATSSHQWSTLPAFHPGELRGAVSGWEVAIKTDRKRSL